MGGHRGEKVLKDMTADGLRAIASALALGVVTGGWWYVSAQNRHKDVVRLNESYKAEKEKKRQQFLAWLKEQPTDAELAASE